MRAKFLKTFLFLLFLLLQAREVSAIPTITVYTYSTFSKVFQKNPSLLQAFEESNKCKVKIITVGEGGKLLNRLRLEGIRTKADVVVGLDGSIIEFAGQLGLFLQQPLGISLYEEAQHFQSTYFTPVNYSILGFVYDKTRLKNPPKSLRELVYGKHPIKVVIQDPRTSLPGFGLMLWMQMVFGKETPQAWRALAPKILTITKGWSESYQLFRQDQADMVLSYTTSPAVHEVLENNFNYQTAIFSDGHYLQSDVAGVLKTSKYPELAQRFVEYLQSPALQKQLALSSYVYPSVSAVDVAWEELPIPEKTYAFPKEEIAKSRQAWLREWLGSMVDN